MKNFNAVWWAKRISGANVEVPQYSKPEKIYLRPHYLTIVPSAARGLAEILKHGETLKDTWTAIANANYFEGKFSVGDVFYIDGVCPCFSTEEENGYGTTANAVVADVSYVSTTISLVLKRNYNQIENENY